MRAWDSDSDLDILAIAGFCSGGTTAVAVAFSLESPDVLREADGVAQIVQQTSLPSFLSLSFSNSLLLVSLERGFFFFHWHGRREAAFLLFLSLIRYVVGLGS